jgi:hypothetical protein
MEYEFTVSNDGLVEVVVADGLPLMKAALQDSLSSHPPQGAPQDGPSTYWIDKTLRHLEARLEDGGEEPIASGNATYLQLRHGLVEARYVFDPEDAPDFDAVPAEEVLALLQAWRRRILMSIGPRASDAP